MPQLQRPQPFLSCFSVFEGSAPSKDRTCDLGFRNSPLEISARDEPKSSQESVYSPAEEMPVPALSHDPAVLRAELERATAAGDWLRVAELARVLALAPT